MPKTNDAALHTFIDAKAEIDAMIERLAALSENGGAKLVHVSGGMVLLRAA